MKPLLSRKNSSNLSGGSGNNSDNSGICSIGNNSFGFNFDTEETMVAPCTEQQQEDAQAADNAVASLSSIAKEAQAMERSSHGSSNDSRASSLNQAAVVSLSSGGDSQGPPSKKSRKNELGEDKREERNAREKERSFRISRQINELRNLLSSGGVIVPKGTKSSVLTEAANYIRMLQQHQYRSEIDRHQLVQQMQMIGSGALGPQAAKAIRHVAAQNGVWSLGNFGGVPPKSAMSYFQDGSLQPNPTPSSTAADNPAPDIAPVQTKIEDHEYRFVFNSCSVGMAIASMGGAFIDCNQLFCHLSNYTKQEVCAMTVFNLTSREDLQNAFDLISQMISPSGENRNNPRPCVLRGAMKNRHDLGLSVALIKGDDGIAKCFCVTLIKNPRSPFDSSKPIPATADMIQVVASQPKDDLSGSLNSSPAYTTG